MNNKFTFIIALLFSFIFNVSFAQDGANDPTFNPGDTGYSHGTDAPILTLITQPDGKIIIGGGFEHYFTQNKGGIVRLNSDQSLDTTFNVGVGTNGTVTTTALQPDGKILIAGDFTTYNNIPCNKIARLNIDGSLDNSFNRDAISNYASISKVFLQADGKLLVAYNSTANVIAIVRLNSDGSVDAGFNADAATGSKIADMVIQSDGKIILGGSFSRFNDVIHTNVVRLNTDGITDNTFNAAFSGSVYGVTLQSSGKVVVNGFGLQPFTGLQRYNEDGTEDATFIYQITNTNRAIRSVIIQPDGKMIIAGAGGFARLTPDGVVDTSFTPVTPTFGATNALSLLPDGKLLMAGDFLIYNGFTTNYLAKFNSDGTLDTSFTIGNGTGANGTVDDMVTQANGKILIKGSFSFYNGIARKYIAQLTSDGLIDETFNPGTGPNGAIYNVKAVANGKFMIAGSFTQYNGATANQIARINADGSLDTTFNAGTGFDSEWFSPEAMDVQSDGKIIIGSSEFTTYNGVPCDQLIRLNTDGTLDETFNTGLNFTGDTSTILRIIALSAEEKIIIGTTDYNNPQLPIIVKLNYDGTPDTSFTPIGTNIIFDLSKMAVQQDGKIFLDGYYSQDFGNITTKFMRFNSNGTADVTFREGELTNNFEINVIYPQHDGKIVIAGKFDNWFPQLSNVNLIRINSNGTLDETFQAESTNSETIREVIPQGNKLLICGDFINYGSAGRNRIARITNSNIMGIDVSNAANNNIMVYRNNNALQISSDKQLMNEVRVYDIAGRLLSDAKNINGSNTSIDDISPSHKILIVNIKLADNSIVSKKIYY